MSDERAAKLRRLDALKRAVPHVSAPALSAIIGEIHKHGLPDLCCRNAFKEAKRATTNTQTPYGSLHQVVSIPCNILQKRSSKWILLSGKSIKVLIYSHAGR